MYLCRHASCGTGFRSLDFSRFRLGFEGEISLHIGHGLYAQQLRVQPPNGLNSVYMVPSSCLLFYFSFRVFHSFHKYFSPTLLISIHKDSRTTKFSNFSCTYYRHVWDLIFIKCTRCTQKHILTTLVAKTG